MAPKESEKKAIQEKIAKVREVVDNVTNNDIIMVLHSFDLNVNKTISAFLEDGASSILGGWTTSTGVSVTAAKKKKNKNKKASENVTPATTPSAPVPLKSVPAPVVSAPASSSVTKSAAPSKTTATIPAPTDAVSTAFKSIRLALNEREKELKQSNPTQLDTSAILKAIAALGGSTKPVANGKPSSIPSKQTSSPPPAAGPIKHATSQSSITSSVGADSGVNLSPTHKEEKKTAPKTVINSGGVQLTSSGLSADQLAALQQTLQLTMAARGLDASLITSSENVPRRPKNNNNNKAGEAKKSAKGAQKDQPKLTIL
uniref:Uncharacterized protein n=1 Tax=Caenorhabditis tropicalis TaxID=1561998 RepID=A0A1I7TKR3_9PELO